LEVKDDVEEGCLKDVWIKGIEIEGEAKVQGSAVEADSSISKSSEASRLRIQEPQLLQNISVGP
jgi:hypothetical protein